MNKYLLLQRYNNKFHKVDKKISTIKNNVIFTIYMFAFKTTKLLSNSDRANNRSEFLSTNNSFFISNSSTRSLKYASSLKTKQKINNQKQVMTNTFLDENNNS